MIRRVLGWLLAFLCAAAPVAGLLLGTRQAAPDRIRAVPHAPADVSPVEIPHGEVDVNGGDAEELSRLRGVGETVSALILAEREANGPFRYPEDLLTVRGIGPATLAGFRDALDLRDPAP